MTTEIRTWSFLTNHAQVLLCISDDPASRLRDISERVGITERAAHRIVSELVEGGYVVRERHGRRNRYEIKPDRPLPHSVVKGKAVGDLLELIGTLSEDGRRS